MTRMIEKNAANDEVKVIYEDIESHFGLVPNLFKLMAHDPQWLKSNWEREKRIMLGDGPLDPKTRELIAMAVSVINNCDYCTSAHELMARQNGASDQDVIHAREIIELFASFNAIANAHPDLESDIKPD